MDSITFIPQSQMLRFRDQPEVFATAARINALGMATKAGVGHLGGSFSAIDIMTWLYLREMAPEDVFILSKGHAVLGLYAILHGVGLISNADLLTFRDGKGGLPAHPVIGTPGIVCNTGSLGMGISKAKGMIFADRLAGVRRRYFVLVGDGEIQEGQIHEALRPHCQPRFDELAVLLDNNGIQGNGWVAATRPVGKEWLAHPGWGVTMDTLLALSPLLPIGPGDRGFHFIPIPTTKGKGVSFMEGNPAWHSRTPSQQEYETALSELLARLGAVEVWTVPHVWPPPMRPEPLIAAYGQALLDAAGRHPELVVLDADLAREHGLLPFREHYPDRFFECGIAEQDMVSIASGMALRGLLPMVHSHAAFLTRRALDQVHNQVTEGTHVVYVGGSAGKLQPTGNGKSHETLVDDSVMALTGAIVYQPLTPEDVPWCLERALSESTSSYLRLLKQPDANQQFLDTGNLREIAELARRSCIQTHPAREDLGREATAS